MQIAGGPSASDRPGLSGMARVGPLAITLMIGLHFSIGGNWGTYLVLFRRAGFQTFEQALAQSDLGYAPLNWTAQQLGSGVWLVNLASGSSPCTGLPR